MPAPTLTTLALDHATERVQFLADESDRLARALHDLEDQIRDVHAALRDAHAALRAMREAADVPAGVE